MFDAFLRFCHRFERRVSSSVLACLAGLFFLTGVAGVASGAGADGAKVITPVTSTTVTTAGPSTTLTTTIAMRKPIDGFRTAVFTVTPPSGGGQEAHCGMLADSADQRARGLMNQQDLHGYDSMVFVFPEDATDSFYMANVPVPLDVAWFDGAGNFVSAATMEVCAVSAPDCPRYGAQGSYRYALETTRGGLSSLHVGAGSVLAIGPGGSCT